MHMRLFAPLLSAAASIVRIWIMIRSPSAPASGLVCALDDAHESPRLARRQTPTLGDIDDVTLATLALLVVCQHFRRAAHVLAVLRMLDQALDADRDGL